MRKIKNFTAKFERTVKGKKSMKILTKEKSSVKIENGVEHSKIILKLFSCPFGNISLNVMLDHDGQRNEPDAAETFQ